MRSTLTDRSSEIVPDHGATDLRPYTLGYSEDEFRRLEQQGALFRDLTEDVQRREQEA